MKNEKIIRETSKQNDYKKRLKKESTEIYGVEKCYASHKQYKGLIASHIKPYKICYLEGDEEAEFDINNGLLLSKAVDDYFDELLLTFDENGKIILSESIPNDIKDDFKFYSLDNAVYNDKRREYMRIHRSLFYYKNYIQASESYDLTRLSTDNLQISYSDNGIKVYKNTVIVNNNGIWDICPTHKVKSTFVSRSNQAFDSKYYVTNSDFLSKLLEQKEYNIEKLSLYFNCPNNKFDLNNSNAIIDNDAFKLNTTNYDLEEGTPKKFLDLLHELFAYDDEKINSFGTAVKESMLGNGYNKNIVLNGDYNSFKLLQFILQKVFGSYIYEYPTLKDLRNSIKVHSIPNCNILIINLGSFSTSCIKDNVYNEVLENNYFAKTVININKYVPLYYTQSKNYYIDNSLFFTLKGLTNSIDINDIVDSEGGKILNWFLTLKQNKYGQITEKLDYTQITNKVILDWINNNCEKTDILSAKTSASLLYEDFLKYSKAHNFNSISQKMFCIEISNYFSKKRNASGIYYMGIKLKDTN